MDAKQLSAVLAAVPGMRERIKATADEGFPDGFAVDEPVPLLDAIETLAGHVAQLREALTWISTAYKSGHTSGDCARRALEALKDTAPEEP